MKRIYAIFIENPEPKLVECHSSKEFAGLRAYKMEHESITGTKVTVTPVDFFDIRWN